MIYIQIFLNLITACFKDINREHIPLKLTAYSSGGNVFTCFLGKRPVPWSTLPLLSPFPKPQLCSSWCFNPGSVRTSSGSKSPAAQKETASYYMKSMLHSTSIFLVFWLTGYNSKFNFGCWMKNKLFKLCTDTFEFSQQSW
jgi:hypothetical protein